MEVKNQVQKLFIKPNNIKKTPNLSNVVECRHLQITI